MVEYIECVCCDVSGFGPLGLYSVLGVLSYHFYFLTCYFSLCVYVQEYEYGKDTYGHTHP